MACVFSESKNTIYLPSTSKLPPNHLSNSFVKAEVIPCSIYMCSLCFLPTVIHSALGGADAFFFFNTKGPGSVIQNK